MAESVRCIKAIMNNDVLSLFFLLFQFHRYELMDLVQGDSWDIVVFWRSNDQGMLELIARTTSFMTHSAQAEVPLSTIMLQLERRLIMKIVGVRIVGSRVHEEQRRASAHLRGVAAPRARQDALQFAGHLFGSLRCFREKIPFKCIL